ncbi:MAG: DUF6504 family protein [Nocardioides sp.]|jgi:hypothetical protein
MRRYEDLVEVRRGVVGGAVGEPGEEGPAQFLWRGRLWKVRTVLAHWVETGSWWHSDRVRAVVGSDDAELAGESAGSTDLLAEREFWRVEAGRGEGDGGVFDLSFSWDEGSWQLVGCVD